MKLLTLLMAMCIGLAGCGSETKTVEYVPVETGGGDGGGSGGGDDSGGGSGDGGSDGGGSQKISYAQMQGLMNNYCAACHASAQFMQSERALTNSSVKDRVWNKSMPPSNAGKKLPDRERQLMLSFF